MALVDNAWYVNSVTYGTVTAWAAATSYAAGNFRRQLATPAVNSERCFVCIVAGTSHATTEPTWVLTRGAKTTDNTVTWMECTGLAAMNGDAVNTPSWTITATPPGGVKNTAVSLGQVIKRDSGASYQICTTAGTCGNGAEPSFSDTAGVTTTDNTVTWTSLGVVGNFTGWQYPIPRIFMSNGWAVAGDIVYIASEHAESQAASISTNLTGSINSPTNYLCVTKTNVPPTSANLTTGASITNSGNVTTSLSGSGVYCYFYGITINSGTTGGGISINLGASCMVMERCNFNRSGGNGTNSIAGNGADVTCIDCGFGFGNTADTLGNSGVLKIIGNNTSFTGSIPTKLIINSSPGSRAYFDSVDLSGMTSGITNNGAPGGGCDITFKNCKLYTGTPFASPLNRGAIANVINCDSTTTNYRHEKYMYEGTQTIETTIVRTGGATNGTTPIAWKIVTGVGCVFTLPFISLPISAWNDTAASSRTITLYGIWGGGAVPTNADIWFEVNFMGSSATPIGSFATCGLANVLAAETNLTTDSSTWGGSTTKFKMSVTLSAPQPSMKGPIYITIKAAKVSSTFYIDPKPVIT